VASAAVASGRTAGRRVHRAAGTTRRAASSNTAGAAALITLAIVTATLLEIVDVTIVNVALPNIQGNFGASVDQAAWIGTGYIIANVIVIPLTPWLQRRFGRRQYYAASIAIFLVASIMCGLSGSLEELVFWRIVQGLGGGGLISTSQAILRETYPLAEQGQGAGGIFSMGVIVGPTLGPVLGGFITDQLSWRWAFFINVLPGILAIAIVLAMLRNPEKPTKMPLDYIGLGISRGRDRLAAVRARSRPAQGLVRRRFDRDVHDRRGARPVAFVIWELRQARPIVNSGRACVTARLRPAASSGMVLGISLYGSVLILPQYVQGSLGFTATLSGEMLVFRAGTIHAAHPVRGDAGLEGDGRCALAGRMRLRADRDFELHAGDVTTTGSDFWTFFWALALSGVGLAQIFVPLTVSVLSSVQPRDIPGAAAFFNLSRQIGGSIAIAVLVTILARDKPRSGSPRDARDDRNACLDRRPRAAPGAGDRSNRSRSREPLAVRRRRRHERPVRRAVAGRCDRDGARA
jgi:DHA2 family multidrug resistance protein